MGWQLALTIVLVALAALYLVGRAARLLRGRFGSCDACPGAGCGPTRPADAPPPTPLGRLRGR